MKVAFLTTHPIQYHSGWFRALACEPRLDLEVLYCHKATAREQAEAGFGVPFEWDMPLLEGHSYRFLHNVAAAPSIQGFRGLDTPELRTLLQKDRYDAVVINGWHYKSAWQAMHACWRNDVPVLVRSDSHLHTERHAAKRALKALPYRWFISKIDGCLAVGTWSADYFLHYGARSDRIFIVPHAIDTSFERNADALKPRRDEWRRDWKLTPDETVFLFAGKFVTKKRPADFVHALTHAHRQNPRVAGLMVGDGPLRAECQRMVADARVPIQFAGFLNQSEIARAYVAADALVLPSDGGETWGVVVNEAMTCGRPCLVSDRVGSGPDLVVPGQTGFVFSLGDIGGLASHMEYLADRHDQIHAMGVNAMARIRAYSISAAVDAIVDALSRVVMKDACPIS